MSQSRTYRDAVAVYFKERPGQWVSAYDLMRIGGTLAFRTRISEVRRLDGLQIENKVERDATGKATSWYRYVPQTGQGDLFARAS